MKNNKLFCLIMLLMFLAGTCAVAPVSSVGASEPDSFTIEQTLSDNAQEMTIAFDGLSFLTGNLGADSFFPPGKVADFWGFQYLRDNDPSEMGHNTDFLTRASLNMFVTLTADQKAQLVALAKSQVDSINEYGYKRFVLMTAFRRLLDGDLPSGTNGLDKEAVKAFSAELYRLDGEISLQRAQVMGNILHSLDDEQKTYLANMVGKGMTSWPDVTEPDELRLLTQDEKIAVMTYAGDLFSWYAGSLDADVYFCPERQGTYFGSFYMKDAPAVGNPGYSIGTNITADMGKAFIETLNPEQAQLVTSLVDTQRQSLLGIVTVRTQVSMELRKFMLGQSADSAAVLDLMEQYGELDGFIVYSYATNFTQISQSLSEAQKASLMDLRYQTLGDFTPEAAFLYSTPIDFPEVQNTDFLFAYNPRPGILSSVRSNTNPTYLASVDFVVTFSEPVTGVDVGDFKLTGTLLTGASITGVSGSGDTYTITVNTGTGNGTIRLDARDTAIIQNSDGYFFVGPYAGGEIYTISKGTAPTVPVLKLPANNALVTTFNPTLDWNDSSEVMALEVPGWHYEINVTSPYGYNETFTTEDDTDPLVGLGTSQYTFNTVLPESTTFTWKVRAYNDQNQYSAWSASRTFRTPAALVPEQLSAPVLTLPADTTTLNNKRPTFIWEAVSGATSYTLQILSSGKAVNTGTIKAPLHSYTPAKDLLPETIYTWQVKANGKVSSGYSAPFTFKTSVNPPAAPMLVSPTNKALVSSTVAQTLKWKLFSGSAASYEVEYATDATFSDSETGTISGTELSLAAGSLLSNRTYYWRVRSWSEVNAKGDHSTWSAVRTFRTKLSTPVLNLPEDGTTLDTIRPTFTWDEVPGATTYTLQILKDGKAVVTGNIKAPAYVYTPVKDLLPGITYTWKVKANGANPGDYSAPNTFTTSVNPPKVPVLSAPANNALVESSVAQVFKWGAVLEVVTPASPAAGSYEVEYATNAGFINSSPTIKVNAPATETSSITLLPGRTYYWHVRSWSGLDGTGNHSAWSVTRTIKVKFVTPVLDSVTVTGGSPTFVWHSDNGLWKNYTLLVLNSTTNKVVKSYTVPAPTTTYTIPAALLPAGTYKWQVKINGLYTPVPSAVSVDTFTK